MNSGRNYPHQSTFVLTIILLLIVAGAHAWASEPVFQKTYNAPASGEPVTETDSFTVDDPSGDYWLKVINGSGSGQRADEAYIAVNGEERIVIDSPQPAGTIRKKISLQNTNTIDVQLPADPDGVITITIFPVRLCGDRVVAGPWTFHPTETQEVSFPIDAAELLGPCFIRIYNGAPDGSNRVFSADVGLNGQPITDHMEISLMIGFFKEYVTLDDTNTLSVQAGGTPNCYVTIDIVSEYVAAGPWRIASQDLPCTDAVPFFSIIRSIPTGCVS